MGVIAVVVVSSPNRTKPNQSNPNPSRTKPNQSPLQSPHAHTPPGSQAPTYPRTQPTPHAATAGGGTLRRALCPPEHPTASSPPVHTLTHARTGSISLQVLVSPSYHARKPSRSFAIGGLCVHRGIWIASDPQGRLNLRRGQGWHRRGVSMAAEILDHSRDADTGPCVACDGLA